MSVTENLMRVREKVEEAARRSGRRSEDITVVAVTKGVPPDVINQVIAAGIRDIGENRWQEARGKLGAIDRRARLHFVGHLQTNKAKDVLGSFDLIHSLDRWSLALELNARSGQTGTMARTLVQVNVSGEPSKFGLPAEHVLPFLERVAELPHLRVEGLMTIAPLNAPEEALRLCFRRLRLLAEEIRGQGLPGVNMDCLSMGMSDDYPLAIEEGASMIRVGRAIFGQRA